jgi:radical SAM superfamily enzyme YgiQ (UPF0313 family)
MSAPSAATEVALTLPTRPEGDHSLSVALVRPPMVVQPHSLSTHGPTPPIGLAYIAAMVGGAGHRVSVVDAVGSAIGRAEAMDSPVGPLRRIGLSPVEVVERIDGGVDVIGITLMFVHEWPQVREIVELARRRLPAASIVVGGETATSFWRWMFEQTDAIDHVVLGEGEATIVDLLERIANGASVDGMPGVVSHERSGARSGGLPTRMRRLDEVPRPDWGLFDLDAYLAHLYFGVDRGTSMPVLATRGCPYKCSFCSSPQMWTTRYVVREPDDVIDEIADYVDRYGVRNINFCDLTAITKRKWTLDFCDAFDRRGLRVTWQLPVGTRAEALDAEVLQRLYDTGCRNITYAPESGSARMLGIYDKRIDLSHVLASLRAAHGIGLKTSMNIIIGHPDERYSDILLSLRFMFRAALAGCDDCAVIVFCPYPGSADFERLRTEGRLVIDEAACYVGFSRSSSEVRSFNRRMPSRVLRLAQFTLLAVFYGLAMLLHPTRVVALIRSQVTGQESTYLDQMVRSRRRARQSWQGRRFRRPTSQASPVHPIQAG